MLIRSFQVYIRRPLQLLALVEYAGMRNAGIKPDVERIRNLVILFGFGAKQLSRIKIKPRVDATFFHSLRDLLH